MALVTFSPNGLRPGLISMFQLFVAPTPFEGWGEYAYDGTSQRQLLAVLIVSVGAIALTLCHFSCFFLANCLSPLIRVASLYRPV